MTARLTKLLESFDRSVYHLADTSPAVFYLADREGGGVLINTPPFDPALLAELSGVAPLKFLFFPSHFGAVHVDAWRAASGARSLAYGREGRAIAGTVDLVLDREHRFSRTIDFLPMSGRTESTCALRCRNKPGIVFFGPILSCGESGWPTLVAQKDDHSYENRVFGALGLKDLKFEYAFTDDFTPGRSRFGPGADVAIKAEIDKCLAD